MVVEAEVVKQLSRRRLNAIIAASPNQTRQRITALPSHQSTADFFNGICAKQPPADWVLTLKHEEASAAEWTGIDPLTAF
jgi:hypothetical protein